MQAQDRKEGLQVAIVGGGVCGLICAIALKRRGITAQIYEAAVRRRHHYTLLIS